MYKSILKAAAAAVFFCMDCADDASSYSLNIEIMPIDAGTVSRDPDRTSYKAGDTVTVTATAKTGYEFASWSGAFESAENTITFRMDRDAALTANFRQASNTYTVTFHANGGSGEPPGKQTPKANFSVTLPNQGNLEKNGYDFGGWNTDSSGAGDNYAAGSSYTPDGDVTLYAKWTPGGAFKLTDSRDGQAYKTVEIGEKKFWMAENLNYDIPDDTTDVCYENRADNCAKYGRLYNWHAALTACPDGYHLPSDDEWEALVKYAGGAAAGAKLKSTSGWYNNGNGTDDYGFSALPGGYGRGGDFIGAGSYGDWWSATERDTGSADAWNRSMSYDRRSVSRDSDDSEAFLFSVRCVKD